MKAPKGESLFTLAHVSDWHATSLADVRGRELVSKRFFGWLSWRFRRRDRHQIEVLRLLFDDLHKQEPDHVAVTGDLTNVSLESEFHAAGELLSELGSPGWVSVIPGNHDAYVRVAPERGWDHWADFMASDAASDEAHHAARAPRAEEFPTLRVRDGVALIGVSTALATPLFQAWGRIGEAQLGRLEALLERLRDEDLCRVVLMHHPATESGLSWRRRLHDAQALRGVLRRAGADLVLHGHGHRTALTRVPGPDGAIPVVGVRSASDGTPRPHRRAQYHLYRIERRAGSAPGPAYRIELQVRGYDEATGGFEAAGELAI